MKKVTKILNEKGVHAFYLMYGEQYHKGDILSPQAQAILLAFEKNNNVRIYELEDVDDI